MQPETVGQVISVNVGMPATVDWKNRQITTSIFKMPVDKRVVVRKLNLEGDQQSDLSVHGGPDKAIYVYPVEYYNYWRQEFPNMTLGWGMFGENLTISGLLEDTVNIGDRFQIGTVEVVVTQPRLPCYKLGLKFGREDMVKRFLKKGYTGFYLCVLKEGEIGAGDKIVSISKDEQQIKVSDITRLYLLDKADFEGMKRAVQVEALPQDWKALFQERLS